MDEEIVKSCFTDIEGLVLKINNLNRTTGTDKPISIMVIFGDGLGDDAYPHVAITNATDPAVIRELRKTYVNDEDSE